MRIMPWIACVVGTCLVALAGARAEVPRGTFNPDRHMRVADVTAGMTGYGLSVFSGTTVERFDVEVISVLRNFNPRHHVILIRCSGANLEHTGAIAGMSGSPIYLKGGDGRHRMVGALAYGWPMLKDPLAGVQPIEYMLELMDRDAAPPVAASQPAGDRTGAAPKGAGSQNRSTGGGDWSLNEVFPMPGRDAPPRSPVSGLTSLAPNPAYFASSADRSRLQPLATPLMVGGVPGDLLEAYGPLLREYGLVPLQAGGAGTGRDPADPTDARLEPGGALAVPLVSGDIDLTLIGTVTEVIGNQIVGFGHPFVNEGPLSLPMGVGEINGVLARLDQSAKLGTLHSLQGALTTDQMAGVAGTVGSSPRTAPIELRVRYADGSQDLTFRYECAIHPRLTPILGGIALSSAISGLREPPQHHTLEYDLRLEFGNGQVIEFSDIAVNASKFWPLQAVVFPLLAASENPFERAMLSKLSGTVTIVPEARSAEILSVNIPRLKYKPGQTVKAHVSYRPFRAPEAILPVELTLPHDLSDGKYQLVVSGWERYMSDEQAAKPFRFTASNVDEVFAMLRDVLSQKRGALYLRLTRQPDGVAVGRVEMPRLPSSRRQVLLGAGRSNITPFVSSTLRIVPTELAMEGSADFEIEIDADEHVETAAKPAADDAEPDDNAATTEED